MLSLAELGGDSFRSYAALPIQHRTFSPRLLLSRERERKSSTAPDGLSTAPMPKRRVAPWVSSQSDRIEDRVSIWETSVQTWRNGVIGMAMKTSMAAAGLLALAGEAAPAAAVPQIPVHVVVVTTFENGPDSGPNSIGELDRWVTNLPLPETIDFPQGYHHLRYNADKMVLGIETGQGPVHAASSITAPGQRSEV